LTTKIIKRFDLLRSHWSGGDLIWLASVKLTKDKILAGFCYFNKGISSQVMELFPDKRKSSSVRIKVYDELIFMEEPRIIQYLELELANDNIIIK
jgi:hypothetical protein